MKLTQSQLRQIIKEELKRTLKEEKYKSKKALNRPRWQPDEPDYTRAVRRLEELERKYPVMIGALTLRNPVTRDACIQELASWNLAALKAGMFGLGLEGELGAVEEAFQRVFAPGKEGFYTLD